MSTTAHPHWMKPGHTPLHTQSTQTNAWLTADSNRNNIGLGPNAPQGYWIDREYLPRYAAFDAAYQAWEDEMNRTQLQIDDLEDAEKAFIPVYRRLYSHYLKPNDLVTNANMESMGFPKRSDAKPTPNPPPTTHVGVKIVLPGPAEVDLHFFDFESMHRGKPKGVHGAEVKWGLFDTPPVDWSELPNSSFDTNSPLKLRFEGHERGKMLYFSLRWENTTGEKGPWNEMQNIAVP